MEKSFFFFFVFSNLWGFLLVSMLPSINPQQRNVLAHYRVLVLHNLLMVSVCPSTDGGTLRKGVCTNGHSDNLQSPSILILNQPTPSTALDSGKRSVHHLLEIFNSTKRDVNFIGKASARRLSSTGALWREVFPEEGVVYVTTSHI